MVHSIVHTIVHVYEEEAERNGWNTVYSAGIVDSCDEGVCYVSVDLFKYNILRTIYTHHDAQRDNTFFACDASTRTSRPQPRICSGNSCSDSPCKTKPTSMIMLAVLSIHANHIIYIYLYRLAFDQDTSLYIASRGYTAWYLFQNRTPSCRDTHTHIDR
jgi:hypothetical protein